MRLQGELTRDGHLVAHADEEVDSHPGHLVERLDRALLRLCRRLNTPLPVWLPHNSRQIALYHMTELTCDQFLEATTFDRFFLRLIDDLAEKEG